jgi:hypothetical protein
VILVASVRPDTDSSFSKCGLRPSHNTLHSRKHLYRVEVGFNSSMVDITMNGRSMEPGVELGRVLYFPRRRTIIPLGWFTETHFVEFPCYPSKIIIIKVQITTVKSFEPIGDDLDIAIVLQSFHSQITRV